MKKFKAGDKVTYVSDYTKQQGIVKSMSESNPDFVFVVYHCNDDWNNYFNYTGASTFTGNLVKGWV